MAVVAYLLEDQLESVKLYDFIIQHKIELNIVWVEKDFEHSGFVLPGVMKDEVVYTGNDIYALFADLYNAF
ncbi:MAG: hypothetical protein C0594_07845 [Marinilabiliales bacterium]|mgnify:CR=1 FL=1|nr:MAG: hypothetical protein C0594_07845 [Marinilabiliales bacterium]